MKLQQMGNNLLFSTYDDHIVLRLHNAKNLRDTRKILSRFREYLGGRPPSTDLAKSFLSQFENRSPRTQYRYAQMVKGFMKWYGDPLGDLKIMIPKTLPPYTKDDDIEKLLNAITAKKTHKRLIERDYLMVLVGLKTGMRRGELAELEAGDIHSNFLIVRNGKGGKDRSIPLAQPLAERLHEFCQDLKPTDKVFGLKPACISMKIAKYAEKAGLNGFHTHSLRHKFATDLLEHNVNLKIVQELLGHESLETTQVYLSITDEAKRKAIDSLEGPKPEEAYIDDVSAGISPFIYEPKDEVSQR